ncbi:hypothetical protein KAH55_11625, partial [bacterium]|nr:hypothetical protein [bacterium]
DNGYGYIRYQTATKIFNRASAENRLDYSFLLQEASRNLDHSLTGQSLLTDGKKLSEKASKYIPLQDFIVRNSSVSTVVVQGVKKEENPALTTMWTVLGFQLSAVAIPVWPAAGNLLPNSVQAVAGGTAELCDLSLKLKNQCFPIKRGSGNRYLLLPRVVNKQGTGIWQKLKPVENQILLKTEALLASWRIDGLKKSQIRQLNQWLDQYVAAKMRVALQ